MSREEYLALEEEWVLLNRRRKRLQKQLDLVNAELVEVLKKIENADLTTDD